MPALRTVSVGENLHGWVSGIQGDWQALLLLSFCFPPLLRKPKAKESLYSRLLWEQQQSRAPASCLPSQHLGCSEFLWLFWVNYEGNVGGDEDFVPPWSFFYLRDLCRLNLCHNQSTAMPSHFTSEWRVQGCGIEPEMLTSSWLFALWCLLLVLGRKNPRTRARNSQSCLGNRAQQRNGGRRRSTVWWLCVCFYKQG